MKKYSHDNWNKSLEIPEGLEKERRKRLIGFLAKGNLIWFVRRLIGGVADDDKTFIARKIAAKEMVPQSEFLRYMKKLDEDNIS